MSHDTDLSSLFEAVEKGDLVGVQKLLVSGMDINATDSHGMTCIQHAAFKGRADLIKILIEAGADVNISNHEHGYSTLHFAALSGKPDAVKLVLEVGAKSDAVNSVNRTAAQMAAFVSQHQIVSLINNFFFEDALEYFTEIRGLEKEPKLSKEVVDPLHKLVLSSNLNPVRFIMNIRDSKILSSNLKQSSTVLELLSEKNMKQSDTNEVLAMKLHYVSEILKAYSKIDDAEQQRGIDKWIKHLTKEEGLNQTLHEVDKFIRSAIQNFPYNQSTLLHQLVLAIAPGSAGNALHILSQAVNGSHEMSNTEIPCSNCGESGSSQRCSKCKFCYYCSRECQLLHWSNHKKNCPKLKLKQMSIEEHNRKVKATEEVSKDENVKTLNEVRSGVESVSLQPTS